MPIRDPDVQAVANLAITLESQWLTDDEPWRGSPFSWIRNRTLAQKSKILVDLVGPWLGTQGYDVRPSADAESDRLVAGKRVEIRTSTPWDDGSYRFQPVRNQKWDVLVCFGLAPFDARCWAIGKKAVLEQWGKDGGIPVSKSKEEGENGSLRVIPGQEPDWLKPHGGPLSDARKALPKLLQT